MNRTRFLVENISKKFIMGLKKPGMLLFYLKAYALSPLRGKKKIDAYVISYPKCGKTWLRMLYAKYIQESMHIEHLSPDLLDRREGIPFLCFDHEQGNWVPAPIHHANIRPPAEKYNSAPVVFLVRDPRDVLVSSYMHLRYREKLYRKRISSFIRDPYLGIDKIVRYFNAWGEWLCNCSTVGRIISYEQLRTDTEKQLETFLETVGMADIDSRHVERAVALSSFDAMKKREREGAERIPWLRPGDAADDRTYKTRKGMIGEHREVLSEEDRAYVDARIAAGLSASFACYYPAGVLSSASPPPSAV